MRDDAYTERDLPKDEEERRVRRQEEVILRQLSGWHKLLFEEEFVRLADADAHGVAGLGTCRAAEEVVRWTTAFPIKRSRLPMDIRIPTPDTCHVRY